MAIKLRWYTNPYTRVKGWRYSPAECTGALKLVKSANRILNAKSVGLTITLADITEEEFRVLELIEAKRSQPQQQR